VQQTTFYVGANNRTGRVETDKIVQLVSRHFGGGTIIPATGIWKGQTEQSNAVVIGHDKSERYVRQFGRLLCKALHQEAVAVSDGQSIDFVTP